MISHTEIHVAMRNRLLTLSVATTGSVTLAATTNGYTRTTGSFLTDGFAVGMEVTPVGFSTSTPTTVIAPLTATTMLVRDPRVADVAAAGRTLTVGLPSMRDYEGTQFTQIAGVPYVEEDYIPGPTSLDTLGAFGNVTAEPQYSLKVNVPANTGIIADGAYADAILALFCSSTEIVLSNGDKLFVRADTGPYRGQRLPSQPGFTVVPVTIPFRVYTANAI